MTKRSMLLILLVFVAITSHGQDTLAMFKSFNGKWGFINTKGDVVVQPKYSHPRLFKSGFSKINKTQFVNTKGVELDVQFKVVEARDFSNGFAAVYVKGRWGYLNTSGELAIPAKYNFCTDFSNGFAIGKVKNQFFVIDKLGNETEILYLKGKLLEFKKFENNMAIGMVAIKFGPKYHDLFGAINEKGEWIVKPQYAKIGQYNEGLAMFRAKGGFGFLNKKGEVAIESKYREVKNFHLGLARAREKGKWGYINKVGEWLSEPLFSVVGKFDSTSGLARVKNGEGWGYLDRKGKVRYFRNIDVYKHYSNGFCLVLSEKKWGFIDSEGDWLSMPSFGQLSFGEQFFKNPIGSATRSQMGFSARSFKNGYAQVNVKDRWGVINKKGEWVIEPRFNHIKEFHLTE